MDSKTIIKDIKTALDQFGTYTYYDKGAEEVMDMYSYLNKASKMDADELAKILLEVLDYEHGSQFVSCLLCDLDFMPDDYWDKLMEFPQLEELY